jgi:hypothetical protein
MTERRVIDWESIERDYRAGVLTLRAMAAQHGITEGSIRLRAKKEEWPRDLSAKIAAKVKLKLKPVKDEFDSSGYIYVIYLESPKRYYKIGMAKEFNSRFDKHRCASPFDLYVACAFFVQNMRRKEAELHREFASKRVRGEWFELDEGDVKSIVQHAMLPI